MRYSAMGTMNSVSSLRATGLSLRATGLSLRATGLSLRATTRNPFPAWQWIPDQVRDDNFGVRDDNFGSGMTSPWSGMTNGAWFATLRKDRLEISRSAYLLVYIAIKPAKLLVRPVCVLLIWPTMLSIAANCLV